jgi:hypothetical protein
MDSCEFVWIPMDPFYLGSALNAGSEVLAAIQNLQSLDSLLKVLVTAPHPEMGHAITQIAWAVNLEPA